MFLCLKGIYWVTYEHIKQMSPKPTFIYNFIAGCTAGLVIYF